MQLENGQFFLQGLRLYFFAVLLTDSTRDVLLLYPCSHVAQGEGNRDSLSATFQQILWLQKMAFWLNVNFSWAH